MSSILTNTSAMVALQTMKSINKNMAMTQSEISTGKSINSAKDNSAVWAISKTMESDVKGFKGISDSLSLGSTTVGVARKASETVTDLLTQMKGKIVAAQEGNVDRAKLQTDVEALRDQIDSVVGAAQFNGLNLVDGKSVASVDVLASLDRSGSDVKASSITVARQNLATGGYVAKSVFAQGTITTSVVSTDGDTFVSQLDKQGGSDDIAISAAATYAAGDKISLRIGDKTASYTVTATDIDAGNKPADLIAVGLKTAIEGLGIAGLAVDYDSAAPGVLTFTNGVAADTTSAALTISGQFSNATSGGLGALAAIDVSTGAGAKTALGTIETLIGTAIDASAAFGSVQTRIETQSDFVNELTDSLKAGIGSLVDADLEETSARLQALQVQQQLATQALSIANQAPQNLLSLFR